MNDEVAKILLTDFDAKLVIVDAFPKLIVDKASRAIVWSNHKVESLFGCPFSGELNGEQFEILIPERKRVVHDPHWDEFWANPMARMMMTTPLECRRRDGTEFKAQILLAPCKAGVRISCLIQFLECPTII